LESYRLCYWWWWLAGRCCGVCAWSELLSGCRGSMELECLSCHARCSGDLGDSWAEEVLSLQSMISESLAEECETVDVARPPCKVARISGCHGTEMGVCVEVSLDLRHQRSCMCSLSVTVPWWRSSRGRLSLQRVLPRRVTALVTTAQVSAACFSLLSHVVEDGGVLWRVHFFLFWCLFMWWCLLRLCVRMLFLLI
jgi:hypothetical protein